MSNYKFETLQLHVGQEQADPATDSRAVPIYQTTSYVFRNSQHAADRFGLADAGNIYGRLTNSTQDVLEQRVAALEGGVAALATASGAAAVTYTIQALARQGDHIVAQKTIYGGTYNLLAHTLPQYGITATFVDAHDAAAVEAAIQPNTRAVYLETLGNPNCDIPNIEAIAAVAHRHGLPLVIDNTFGAAGYLCNPFEWGANIVVDSATKWINGHGTGLGGVIVDGGNYNWANGKFPQIDGPSEGYHGLNFHEAFGPAAFIVKCRVDGLRDMGCAPSPFDSYLMMIGLETLSLRVKHQVESTWKLAEYCRCHPKVERVSFVGFDTHPSHENARKYYRFGSSAVFNVELKGTLESTVRFVESLRLAANMTMIGDSITVVTHPASTTHKQLSDADLAAAGVTPTLLRISLGLENTDDIIEDFEQAFSKID